MDAQIGSGVLLPWDESSTALKKPQSDIKALWSVPLRIAVHNPSLWEEQQAFMPHVQKLCVTLCKNGKPLISHDVVDWDFASVHKRLCSQANCVGSATSEDCFNLSLILIASRSILPEASTKR